MKVAVPKEIVENERRVALVPESVAKLVRAGIEVLVESGAGLGAHSKDREYEEAGAKIVPGAADLYGEGTVVLKVQPPATNQTTGLNEVDLMPAGTVLIGLIQPLTNLELVTMLSEKGITSFSIDAVPRIARAQKMDALSSMSSLAGYKAALIAANSLGKYFPMMMTAAGTVPPAKGMVLGAGVAGLQAIATARRLGAIMQAFDVRPAVKEQVESLGATFIQSEAVSQATEDAGGYARELSKETQQQERELIHKHVSESDFVISTALIPGKPAPILITQEMVKDMKPGSVIVDIASEMGGNCELTKPGTTAVAHGVIIHGPLNLPSSMPVHASQMYSKNIFSLLNHMIKDGEINLDFEDSIIANCCITHDGRIVHEPTQALVRG